MGALAYRADMDGIRALAILSVLVFHMESAWLPGGFIGVDMFFVLSGFLMTYLIQSDIQTTDTFQIKQFYTRRIRRLLPAYLTTLALTMVVAIIMFSPSVLERFGGALLWASAGVSNMYFWQEAGYFDVLSSYKPLLHTWSLAVEAQFYLIWPLLIYGLLCIKKPWLRYTLLIAIALISIGANISLGLGYGGTWNTQPIATVFFLLPTRLYEFIVGALLVGLINKTLPTKWLYDLVFVIGLAMIALAATTFNSGLIFPGYHALLPCLGTACLIYAGAHTRWHIICTNRLAVGIGKISYSLYLVHWPLFVFWRYMDDQITPIDHALQLVLSLVLAVLSYRYIETPFRTGRRHISATIIVIMMIIIASIGHHIQKHQGWPFRVSDLAVFEQVGDASHFHEAFYGGVNYPYYRPKHTAGLPSIVLIGDSHANHYIYGISELIARPNKLPFYTGGGVSCFRLPGYTRRTNDLPWDELCPEQIRQAIYMIQKGENPLVFMSHAWASQLSQAAILDAHGKPMPKTVTMDDVVAGIVDFADRIKGSPLIVIGQVPTTGHVNLYDRFSRPNLPFLGPIDKTSYQYARPIKAFQDINRRLAQGAVESGKYIFLDPFDVLCHQGRCRHLSREKHLLYSDTSHLSIYGSLDVIEGFGPVIIDILKQQGKL